MVTHPRLFVVSGPSGAGKGTLIGIVRGLRPDLALTVSATTREPRAGEVDGVSYHFLSDDEFDARVAAGEFLEWASLFGHRYGTLRSEVETRLAAGSSIILELDVQGALNVRAAFPEAVLIFIQPPSRDELERRLRERGTEDEASIAERLGRVAEEIRIGERYDVRIVNDDLDRASAELLDTIRTFEK